MITPILEKYLFDGNAKNKIHWFAFSSFTRLNIPDDAFIVIHKIFWTPFLNQKFTDIAGMSWRDFFRYNEYQLNIHSDKDSPFYYIMRHALDFQFFASDPTNPIDLSKPIDIDQYNKYILMQTQRPIIFDCFITSFNYLNFTLTRNSAVSIGVPGPGFQPLNNYANELPPPTGIGGVNVLLEGIFTGNNTTDYQPPTTKLSGQALASNTNFSYQQHIDGSDAFGNNWSMINNPNDAGLGTLLPESEYVTNPLLGFEYCIVQKNIGHKLSVL
jgi:hypothetical protein